MKGDSGLQCKAVAATGKRCNARAHGGTAYCWRHDPDVGASEKLAASQKGGSSAGFIGAEMLPIEVESLKDVRKLIVEAINLMRAGTLTPAQANALGYLGNCLVKVIEVESLETRLEDLERSAGIQG